ncbi:uncharacterized protein LOC129615236 [Condylostylus longicornis]|uniref:uncharacterized protein LOC129615236 n=1 Tax=Condylostylus longicornis TaxID=2530218 RepID=UPI00244DB769|nr:uncharacterized protein LOC129615236 [Condylostylus longicornis]
MKVIFILGLILYLIHDVHSIKCYDCQSDETGVCGPQMISDNGGALVVECKHSCLKAHVNMKGHTVFDRKCVDAKFCEKVKNDKKRKYQALYCEICDTDFCNGGMF